MEAQKLFERTKEWFNQVQPRLQAAAGDEPRVAAGQAAADL